MVEFPQIAMITVFTKLVFKRLEEENVIVNENSRGTQTEYKSSGRITYWF